MPAGVDDRADPQPEGRMREGNDLLVVVEVVGQYSPGHRYLPFRGLKLLMPMGAPEAPLGPNRPASLDVSAVQTEPAAAPDDDENRPAGDRHDAVIPVRMNGALVASVAQSGPIVAIRRASPGRFPMN